MLEGNNKENQPAAKKNGAVFNLAVGLFLSAVTIVVLFITAEVILRVVNYGDPQTRRDPFFGFEGTNNFFYIEDVSEKGTVYKPSPNKKIDCFKFFSEKKPNSCRVFAFGGSTSEGVPFTNGGSFPFRLQQYLTKLYPNKEIEVINCANSGHGSTRVFQILREATNYDPDLFIVYTGQNEFRDALFHPRELRRSAVNAFVFKTLLYSRVNYLLYNGFLSLKGMLLGARQTSFGGRLIDRIISKPFSKESFQSFDYFQLPTFVYKNKKSPMPSEKSPTKGMVSQIKSFIKGFIIPARMREKEILSNFEKNDSEYDRSGSIEGHRSNFSSEGKKSKVSKSYG